MSGVGVSNGSMTRLAPGEYWRNCRRFWLFLQRGTAAAWIKSCCADADKVNGHPSLLSDPALQSLSL